MNKELFESLLYEGESTTLDFKAQQYKFARATEEEKAELLKDILGFVNAWRRASAYILIGVKQVAGARARVLGISEHLDDHSLQQFVNNLTNQPVRFQYAPFGFEGKQVGIICVDQQTRPVYLKGDYGKLLKERVYIRRGSSTDPTKPASLEEIAQMRVGTSESLADLVIEFAEIDRDHSRGTRISWNAEFCQTPESDGIPDFDGERPTMTFGPDFQVHIPDPSHRTNNNFYREMANYEFVRRLFRPVRFLVTNVGQISAKNVRAELVISTGDGVVPMLESKLPDIPKRYEYLLVTPAMAGLRSVIRPEPGEVRIDQNQDRFKLEIECGDLQPGRKIWSDKFYIGKATNGDVLLNGLIYSDNLPEPKSFSLILSGEVKQSKLTTEELISLAEQIGD